MASTARLCMLLAVADAALAPGLGFAQGARVCVLVEEQHDGKSAQAGGAEAKLGEALLAAGYSLVERYDAEQARGKLSLDRMLHGDTAGLELSGLHADVLVVARVAVQTEQAPYGITYPVHGARIDLRAVQVDTGRILHVASTSASAPGDFGAASTKAAASVSPALLDALKRGLAARELIELRIAGLKEARAADAIAESLARLPGVKSAKVRFVSADATSIDVVAPGLDPRKLEAALAGAHLMVARRSANTIEARFDENAVARRSVAVAGFVNRTGRADLAWLESLLPEVFETELSNSKYLQPATGKRETVDPDRVDAARLAKLSGDLVVVGKIETAGATLRLSAKALRRSDGAVLAAVQLFGAEAGVAELGRELVWKLDAPLYLKLSGRSSLEAYVSPLARREGAEHAAAAPSPGHGARVRLDDVKIADLFPARIGTYAQRPLGRVTLRNDGDRPADDVRVEVSLGDLSGGAQTLRVATIAPGQKVEVPIKLVLERQKLLEVTQRRPARADLAVLTGDRRESYTEPFVLWDRNAIDWGESDSVASFVTPKDAVVVAFAEEAGRLQSSLPPSLPPSVRAAAALYDGLLSLGLRYARDPLSPYGERAIDSVQFPRETLARKLGDCDDLAVLYAALVQAAGRDARLVLTPGHIFVAVDAELSAEQADRLGARERMLILDGRAWIPVEVTKLDGGFAGAWQSGLAELGRYRGEPGKVSYVEVPRAWQVYPPFPMDAPGTPPALPTERAKQLLAVDARALHGAGGDVPAVGPGAKPEERLAAAIARARRGSYDEARRELSGLIEGPATPRPVRAAAANGLGNVATLLARYDEATRDYDRALQEGAARAQVEHNLGVASYLAGRGADARKHLSASGTPEARKLLAKLGLAAAEPAKAPSPGAAPPRADTAEAGEGLRGAGGEARVDPASVLIWIGR